MEKLYTLKTFLKMAGGKMHTPHLTPGSVPGYKHQKPSKESAYSSHLAPLTLFFFTKRQSQKGGWGMAQCPPSPKYAFAQVLSVIIIFENL